MGGVQVPERRKPGGSCVEIDKSVGNWSGTGQRPPKIVYACGSHAQLSHALSEFYRTPYASSVSACVLGSQSHLCLNPALSHLRDAPTHSRVCFSLVQQGKCRYYGNSCLHRSPLVKDIEDLIQWGLSNEACPYFISREQQSRADVLFMFYSDLVDRRVRELLQVCLRGAVVIVDEVRNIEDVTLERSSFSLTNVEVGLAISELRRYANLVQQRGQMRERMTKRSKRLDCDLESELQRLLEALEKLKANIETSDYFSQMRPGHLCGKRMFDIFEKAGIDSESLPGYIKIIEHIAAFNKTKRCRSLDSFRFEKEGGHLGAGWSGLSLVGDRLSQLFREIPLTDFLEHYRLTFEQEYDYLVCDNGPIKRIVYWCLNPGLAMVDLTRSCLWNLIFTAGTLPSLDMVRFEFKLSFPVTIWNSHIVSPSQIWVGIVSSAVDGAVLNSSYHTRCDAYKRSLGYTLVNVARITSGGVLVFFPSYRFMEECLRIWKEPEEASHVAIWSNICKYKLPVREHKDPGKLKASIMNYYQKVADQGVSEANGAILFVAYRGKACEELDLTDDYGRAIVVIGIPYASGFDERVKMKRAYLDERAAKMSLSSRRTFTSSDWYNQMAWYSINHVIGRIVRHQKDYGAILFADERFAHASSMSYLSHWLRPYVKIYENPGHAFMSLTKFLTSNKHSFPIDRNPTSIRTDAAHGTSRKPNGPTDDGVINANAAACLHSPGLPKPLVLFLKPTRVTHEDAEKAAQLLKNLKCQLTKYEWFAFQSLLVQFQHQVIKKKDLHLKFQNLLSERPELMAELRMYLKKS
ncbi:uncharacterized protein LOC126326192 [Schistocerca gregaria]|uniref:uncharacterized protein LOC126326192 n=1 Tax=Schistocerca gregaria TaxID=7010 RepID=UPI00211E24B9|nr:uncharacterized protein LOC126326192 [Schistocerca gregaria]